MTTDCIICSFSSLISNYGHLTQSVVSTLDNVYCRNPPQLWLCCINNFPICSHMSVQAKCVLTWCRQGSDFSEGIGIETICIGNEPLSFVAPQPCFLEATVVCFQKSFKWHQRQIPFYYLVHPTYLFIFLKIQNESPFDMKDLLFLFQWHTILFSPQFYCFCSWDCQKITQLSAENPGQKHILVLYCRESV